MAYKFEPWRERLRAAVVTSGLTERALSLKAGQKEDYVRHVISPSKNRKPIRPTIEKLHAIVTALDLTLDDLFEEGDLDTSEIMGRMAHRGFARLFSEIKERSPKEQLWILGALEQQLALLERMPNKAVGKPAQLKLLRQDNSDD